MHVHLRQGAMMALATAQIEAGGTDTVLVMPNLSPPITSVAQAVAYHAALQRLAPAVTFLMSLYLHPTVTPAVIAEARASGVVHGVKLYPAGVTTNSAAGVLDVAAYHAVFAAMQEHDLVLNLHGEMPSTAAGAITVLNAEAAFLPQLRALHAAFPRLRIVLEHVSTRQGLDAVRRCGPTVAGTITAHHLWATIEDWCGDVFAYCKPVPKTAEDRAALVRAVVAGGGNFFFGSDSAPHPIQAKRGGADGRGATAAGAFTQPYGPALVVQAVAEGVRNGWFAADDVRLEAVDGFLGRFGRSFYKLPESEGRIRLERKGERIVDSLKSGDGAVEVVPFRRGEEVMSVHWVARRDGRTEDVTVAES